jgi:hypothetical protein
MLRPAAVPATFHDQTLVITGGAAHALAPKNTNNIINDCRTEVLFIFDFPK